MEWTDDITEEKVTEEKVVKKNAKKSVRKLNSVDAIQEELVDFRKRVNETYFRHDIKELEKYRHDKLIECHEFKNTITILEQKRLYEKALAQFEEDSLRILKVRYDKTFEPAKWFEIEVGDGPKVFAMSVDEGTVINIENGGSVYCSCGKIYKVKDKYYLRGDNKWT